MKTKLLTGAAMAAILVSAASAQAQENWPKWYVGLSGSVAFLADSDVSGPPNGEFSNDAGWGVNGALGYRPGWGGWLNPVRLEAELGWRSNDLDSGRLAGGSFNASGETEAMSYMINAYYDINMGTNLTPYLGAGIGIVDTDIDVSSGGLNASDSSTDFGYQLMAGVSYAPTSMPQTEWLVGYRYLSAVNPSYNLGGTKFDIDYDNHNVELGARFRF